MAKTEKLMEYQFIIIDYEREQNTKIAVQVKNGQDLIHYKAANTFLLKTALLLNCIIVCLTILLIN